jgi:predicted O-methyltransferase YrrM
VLGAKAVVEIGTGAGVASLALLHGMAADGILTTIDAEAEYQNVARRVIASTGIRPQRLRTIAGHALVVLPKLSDGAYDLVLIAGEPLEAHEYLEQAIRLLRHGGVLVLHHAMLGGTVADPTNESDETLITREVIESIAEIEDLTPVFLPVGDGLLAAVKG